MGENYLETFSYLHFFFQIPRSKLPLIGWKALKASGAPLRQLFVHLYEVWVMRFYFPIRSQDFKSGQNASLDQFLFVNQIKTLQNAKCGV